MMKKRFVALALMSIMSASMLAACGGKKSDSATSTTATTETTAATDNKSATSTGKKSEAAPEWTAYDELIQSVYQDADLVHREATLHKAEAMLRTQVLWHHCTITMICICKSQIYRAALLPLLVVISILCI